MIAKSDVILLLTDMQTRGYDVSKELSEVLTNSHLNLDVLKKINSTKPLDLVKFYEKLRCSYNSKHSKLYINIMKADENAIKDAKLTLTTLSALLNQILQYECEDRPMFYSHARADEISKVLTIYFTKQDLNPAYQLLSLIKADIIASETINERRN